MKEVICPNGHRNRAGAKFCSYCGQKLPQPIATLPPVQQPGGPFQPPRAQPGPPPPGRSPARARPRPQAPPTPFQHPAGRRRYLLWGGIAILALMIIACIALITMILAGDSDASAASAAATETLPPANTPVLGEAPVSTPVTTGDPLPEPPAVGETVETKPPASTAANLLINGNFSEDWRVSWTRESGNRIANATVAQINVAESDNGSAVFLSRTGPEYLHLKQTAPIIPTQMHFQGKVFLTGTTTPEGEAGRAILMLVYHGPDPAGEPLGWSLWVDGESPNLPWGTVPLPPGPATNVAVTPIGQEWVALDVDLNEEIRGRLLGVDAEAIRHISVILLSIGTANCGTSECQAEVTATDLILTQE
jgi:hypothetical protein